MIRALLLCSLLAPLATAQTTATVPNPVSPQNVDRPFPGGIGRYQQWYSAAALQAALPDPVRIDQIEFFAGTTQSSNATAIDMEVLIGYGQPFGMTGQFDQNFAGSPLLVVPRGNAQLLAGAPGAVVMTLPFVTQFTWDRQRPIVVEIRVHGNSRNNQPFPYNLRGTTVSLGTTTRVYQAGSPGAVSGVVQQGVGMVTRFRGRPGATIEYGTGCPGEGNFVPTNDFLQLIWPGATWTQQVSRVASQRVCIWSIGLSDTMIGTTPLPVDIGSLLGMAPLGCQLRNDVLGTNFVVSVGGGAGAGIATLVLQLPPLPLGVSFYTQWAVLDPMAPNGMLSMSPGVRSIIAPIGG